jgi:hypothetical protein
MGYRWLNSFLPLSRSTRPCVETIPSKRPCSSDISPEERRAHAHPLRLIWDMVDASLSNGWRITSSTLRLNAARLPQH